MSNGPGDAAAGGVVDVLVVGGGAAGLGTAIFAARRNPRLSVVVLDGTRKLGAKILVSGGGRCNVTNRVVSAEDFWGGSRNVIRRILRAFSEKRTVEFFRELGVALHEEEHGKLFPDTNSAKTVLEALLLEASRRGVRILPGHRVVELDPAGTGFRAGIMTSHNDRNTARHGFPEPLDRSSGVDETKWMSARRVVLATGGQSLPRTGSDGGGYSLARRLGHTLIETTPGLVPLVLEGGFHASLSGISQEVEITVRTAEAKPVRLRGSMLWTHFGVSGPVVLDASRHWHRAQIEGKPVTMTVNFLPADTFDSAQRMLLANTTQQPRMQLGNVLSALWPARFVEAILAALEVEARTPMNALTREARRRLVHGLLEFPLPVRDSRGYNYAEVTTGGVPLSEIDPSTMESRKSPGLYLVGEILDVDGRIGGFNFQWAWSTGFVAGEALAQ
jgi:predicted flavoprotein YhiN